MATHAGGLGAGGEPPDGSLSDRQVECLTLISRGLNLEEASRTMSVSERTAKRHLEGARSRLGARSNAHAVMRAVSLGILSPES